MSLNFRTVYQKILFTALFLFCLTPYVDAPIALILGILLALIIGNPYQSWSQKISKWLLKAVIVGLGFGMNVYAVVESGKEGFLFTVFSIVFTLLLGWILGRWLKVPSITGFLVSSGTAICGGSAIAAVGPVLNADEKQMSVALGTVFILNAVALLVFPAVGTYLGLTQHQFGVWSAIAIHDTSSVVGAAQKYGEEALQLATTIKLGRALWIIPLSIFTVLLHKGNSKKINIPYFIGFFILAMLISTFFPEGESVYSYLVFFSKKALVVTLFLIGTGLSLETIRSVGGKTFLMGLLLWIVVSLGVLGVVYYAF